MGAIADQIPTALAADDPDEQAENPGAPADHAQRRATLFQALQGMRPQYAAALPPSLPVDVFLRDAWTCVQRSIAERSADRPSLLECDGRSVLGALMTCAQLGLRPDVRGEAHLIPRWSARYQCYLASFDAGYRGLIKLAYQSGAVKLIYARAVHERHAFDYGYGDAHGLTHKPGLDPDPGELVAFYVYVRLPTGECDHIVWTDAKMRAHRAKYVRNETGPWWDEHTYPQMGRKTMIRQASNELPLTGAFAEALAVDGTVRMDVDPEATAPPARPEDAGEFEDTTAVTSAAVVDADAEAEARAVVPQQLDPEPPAADPQPEPAPAQARGEAEDKPQRRNRRPAGGRAGEAAAGEDAGKGAPAAEDGGEGNGDAGPNPTPADARTTAESAEEKTAGDDTPAPA